MKNKLVLIVAFLISASAVHGSTHGKPSRKVSALPVTTSAAVELISSYSMNASDQIQPDEKQSFKVSVDRKNYYVISAIRPATMGLATFTCSVLLFDESGAPLGMVDVLGAGDLRPWTCNGVVAMSFVDFYADGNLQIIALYDGVAPSSEKFRLSIVLKLDSRRSSLSIDEKLSDKLSAEDIQTISAARMLLKRWK